eukprot:scaffold16326_cov65-Phaeocystis_antarctica.AAC.4
MQSNTTRGSKYSVPGRCSPRCAPHRSRDSRRRAARSPAVCYPRAAAPATAARASQRRAEQSRGRYAWRQVASARWCARPHRMRRSSSSRARPRQGSATSRVTAARAAAPLGPRRSPRSP